MKPSNSSGPGGPGEPIEPTAPEQPSPRNEVVADSSVADVSGRNLPPAGDSGTADSAGGAAANESPRRLRFTRRRLLVVGGVALAGAAATLAGIRVAGGSGGAPAGSGAAGSPSPSPRGGYFPVLNVEQPPKVPAADWVLKVDGLVDSPLTIDRDAWTRLERSSVTADLRCVTGWSADDVRWGGVVPSLLLERAGLQPGAKAVLFHAYGHPGTAYSSSLPLHLVTAPGAILADTLDGEPLTAPHGGPLRLIIPSQLGYKNVKWVVRMEVTDKLIPGYWESRGYPQDAPVPEG